MDGSGFGTTGRRTFYFGESEHAPESALGLKDRPEDPETDTVRCFLRLPLAQWEFHHIANGPRILSSSENDMTWPSLAAIAGKEEGWQEPPKCPVCLHYT